MRGRRILITGATGEVARAIAEAFAPDNEVWAAARFTDAAARARLEAQGIRTFAWTLGSGDFAGLPEDFDHVVHSACTIFPVKDDYDAAIAANAEGTGLLMGHVRRARSFLYISSLNVYSEVADNGQPRVETDPLGCHPRYAPSYSAGKVATEGVVRALCRLFALPVTIGRLGMNYGVGCSGAPDMIFQQMLAGTPIAVPPRGRSFAPLVNNADIVAQVEPLLDAARVPATIVNWTGDEAVDERDMIDHLAAIAGLAPTLEERPEAGFYGGVADPARRIAITGPARYRWKAGFLAMLRANYPERSFNSAD